LYYFTYLTELILLERLEERVTDPSSTNGKGHLKDGKYHNQGAYCYRSIFLVGEFKRCVLAGKVGVSPTMDLTLV